jgi:hypothetical protein
MLIKTEALLIYYRARKNRGVLILKKPVRWETVNYWNLPKAKGTAVDELYSHLEIKSSI